MTNLVVVGSQWGDEGKGKVVDFLSRDYDVVARYNGGCNAGHTVMVGGETYKLHHIPSGIVSGKICVMGNGVIIDPGIMLKEVEDLEGRGIKTDKLYLSSRAHVILPSHRVMDGIKGGKIDTTRRGIGPCYADKMERTGIRVEDLLLSEDELRAKIEANIEDKNFLLEHKYGQKTIDAGEVAKEYVDYGKRLRRHVTDTSGLLRKAIDDGLDIIFEGAQGTLLDIDHGTYPFTTSSSSTAGGACTGSGIGPKDIDGVIGVAKAYVTRVGNGPFPTERFGEWADAVRGDGGEFGTTTGRPRRVGNPDFVILRYARDINSVREWAVTKLDVLGGKEFRVATDYKTEGDVLVPVYRKETFGWEKLDEEDMARIVSDGFNSMPHEMKFYLTELSKFTRVPVSIASLSPDRRHTVTKNVKKITSIFAH